MQNIITEAVSEIKDVTTLANPQVALQHLPSSAKFATVATVMLLDNPDQAMLHFGVGTTFGAISTDTNLGMNGTKYIGYLYHDGVSLIFADATQAVYTYPLASITGINNTYPDFFLILLPENKGLLVSQLTSIQFPADSSIRSTPKISDSSMGWHREFVNLGVISQQQAQAQARSAKVFLIIFVIAFIGLTLLVLIH